MTITIDTSTSQPAKSLVFTLKVWCHFIDLQGYSGICFCASLRKIRQWSIYPIRVIIFWHGECHCVFTINQPLPCIGSLKQCKQQSATYKDQREPLLPSTVIILHSAEKNHHLCFCECCKRTKSKGQHLLQLFSQTPAFQRHPHFLQPVPAVVLVMFCTHFSWKTRCFYFRLLCAIKQLLDKTLLGNAAWEESLEIVLFICFYIFYYISLISWSCFK